MTTNTDTTLTENATAWVAALSNFSRFWNKWEHEARRPWNLTLNESTLGLSSLKLRDLRRPVVLECVRVALGASSVTYEPQCYVASGRGAFGQLKGGNSSRTNAARLRITY